MKDPAHLAPRILAGSSLEQRLDAEALFRDHALFVARFLHHLGVPPEDLEDLVQEVFLVAHRKGGYLPGPAHPRTWLAAIAVRVERTRLRTQSRQRRRLCELAACAQNAEGRAGDDTVEKLMSRQIMERALGSLDLEHRAAFVLYELEGKPCEDVARVLGVPLGTVYSRLHNARRRFLTAYAALAQEPQNPGLLGRRRALEGT